MIDLHTHILPAIDDGAHDTREALMMTESLAKQKVTLAVCTPHFDPSQSDLREFVAKRSYAMSLLRTSRLPLIPASETVLHEYLFHYPDLSKLCIYNTRYLLVELPFGKKWDHKLFDTLDRLITYYDLIPIIAHIERYPAVKNRNYLIKRLQKAGCIIQLNSSAILDEKTKRKAFYYLKKGYIDVLGSDCHNMKSRPPRIAEAVIQIEYKFGAKYCAELEYRADCIINGIELRKKKSYIME